jgi:preprotein translocase subunit YajC
MLGLAYAMGTAPGGGQGATAQAVSGPIMLLVMFGIFYFLLIRPQQKKAKEHRDLLDSLKKGDLVITAGGMHGKVTAIDEKVVNLEVAPGVNIKFGKGYIASLEKKETSLEKK